jgi:ABC-type nitrate/sulfonate/bicarbonate transport system permease component
VRPVFRSLIGLGGFFALWEIAARSGLVSRTSIPPPSEVLARLGDLLGEETFLRDVLATVLAWAIALVIAIGIAVPAGLLLGSIPGLRVATRAIVEFLRPIPSVALIPLAILIYGTGLQSKVFLAAFAAFWVLLVQTLYGVQDVDPVATDTARSFGLSRTRRLFRVTLPSAIPYIATGIRMASTVALILAVTAELVIGSAGLGRSINIARSGGNVELMYALIIVTGMLGWLLNDVFARVERRVLHWHPSQRSSKELAPA